MHGAAGTSGAEKWQNMAFSWGNIRFVRPFWTEAFLNLPSKWVIHREIKEEHLSIWQHSLVDASEWSLQGWHNFEEHQKGGFHFILYYILQETRGDTAALRRTSAIPVLWSWGLHWNTSWLMGTFKHLQLVGIFTCYNFLFFTLHSSHFCFLWYFIGLIKLLKEMEVPQSLYIRNELLSTSLKEP